MKNKITLAVFVVLGMGLGYTLTPAIWQVGRLPEMLKWQQLILGTVLGGGIFYVLGLVMVPALLYRLARLEKKLTSLNVSDVLFSSLFMIGGLLLAIIISIPLFLKQTFLLNTLIPVCLMLVLGYLGFRLGDSRAEDWRKLFAGSRRRNQFNETENLIYREEDATVFHQYKILDTSVIIDGRIVDIAKSGFIEGVLLVPDFVVHELQLISDSADNLKRAKGRRGLDILNEMKNDESISIESYSGDFEDLDEVDLKLIKLAKLVKGVVVTNDYNLNKVASFQNVNVLNINNLANAVKPAYLPGETMTVMVIKNGTERQQGVAYLPDGTMVVIENGQFFLNKRLEVTVTSAIQTDAGRMIFAKPVHSQKEITEANETETNNNQKNKKSARSH